MKSRFAQLGALSLGIAAGFGVQAVQAMGTGSGAPAQDAQAQYQQDRSACLEGRSTQDRATCLKEAAAAYSEARHGSLDVAQGPDQYRQNQRKRCQQLSAKDRDQCLAMHDENPGSAGVRTLVTVIPLVPTGNPSHASDRSARQGPQSDRRDAEHTSASLDRSSGHASNGQAQDRRTEDGSGTRVWNAPWQDNKPGGQWRPSGGGEGERSTSQHGQTSNDGGGSSSSAAATSDDAGARTMQQASHGSDERASNGQGSDRNGGLVVLVPSR